MSSRQKIRQAAAENGWTLIPRGSYTDLFRRDVQIDPESKLGRFILAAAVPWKPGEHVFVGYTAVNALWEGRLYTPKQQSALTGTFVGEPERETKGKNKADQIIAWLRAPARYAPQTPTLPTQEEVR